MLAHTSIAAAPDNCWTPITGLAGPATASFNRRIDDLFDAFDTSVPCTIFFLPNYNADRVSEYCTESRTCKVRTEADKLKHLLSEDHPPGAITERVSVVARTRC